MAAKKKAKKRVVKRAAAPVKVNGKKIATKTVRNGTGWVSAKRFRIVKRNGKQVVVYQTPDKLRPVAKKRRRT